MRNNPFYVEPGNDWSQGLTGLTQSIQHLGEVKSKERAEEKYNKMKEGAVEAFKTQDPKIISEFMLKNPEMATAMQLSTNYYDSKVNKPYFATIYNVLSDPTPENVEKTVHSYRSSLLEQGPPTEESAKRVAEIDGFLEQYKVNPEKALKKLEFVVASLDPKKYKAWKKTYESESDAPTNLKKTIDEREALLKKGVSKDDPRIKAYDEKLWPENKTGASPLKKLIDEKAVLLENGEDPTSDVIKGYNIRILGNAAEKMYGPSPLKKLIKERQEYINEGMKEDDPVIKAYDNKISGIDIDIEEMSDPEIDTWGAWVNATGRMPSVGRGKQATKIRARILKSAARQALAGDAVGDPKKTPLEAAMEVVGKQADTKSIASALGQLEKQLGAMGSFINNMDRQVSRFTELANELDQGGIRILNVPRRLWRSKIQGHPLQAKYDLYLTEIEAEIGKLAQGSPQSIAELSTHAQEKWDKIHDKNLGAEDIISLIEETSHAAKMRIRSVEDQLETTRKKMRDRKYTKTPIDNLPTVRSKAEGGQADFDALESGDKYRGSDGKIYTKP